MKIVLRIFILRHWAVNIYLFFLSHAFVWGCDGSSGLFPTNIHTHIQQIILEVLQIFWDHPIYKLLEKKINYQDHRDVLFNILSSPRKLSLSHPLFTDFPFLPSYKKLAFCTVEFSTNGPYSVLCWMCSQFS